MESHLGASDLNVSWVGPMGDLASLSFDYHFSRSCPPVFIPSGIPGHVWCATILAKIIVDSARAF